ncbi:MAG: leucine dehydrogenase [Acidimicrobiia bacterium]|nr:leucine dehydrogenase [Acidimicrobiia bacterium]
MGLWTAARKRPLSLVSVLHPGQGDVLGVFEVAQAEGHEEVLFGSDPVSGLRTIIAIHSTALGPALGGTRFYPYATEDEALTDVLRLAKGMTYKSAAAGLDLGGGKAVIIGDPRTDKTERLLRAYARVIDSLGGRYVTAEDVGTTTEDMITISRETKHVSGLPAEYGGSGDPSPATATGVLSAIRATARHLWGDDDLTGRRFAIQGVGKVGGSLAELLVKSGASIVVSDTYQPAVDHAVAAYGATAVGVGDIYDVECDLFAPCALGASFTADTIPRLRCEAIAGSANNQLETTADADRLIERGITYVPDFIVNAGGVINIQEELHGSYSWERAAHALEGIGESVTKVLTRAAADDTTPVIAARRIAEDRIEAVGGLRLRRRPGEPTSPSN